tara:strand:- start:472 stop:831 length:360 start_codon:yes stop_codon:yes gene_type:complete
MVNPKEFEHHYDELMFKLVGVILGSMKREEEAEEVLARVVNEINLFIDSLISAGALHSSPPRHEIVELAKGMIINFCDVVKNTPPPLKSIFPTDTDPLIAAADSGAFTASQNDEPEYIN